MLEDSAVLAHVRPYFLAKSDLELLAGDDGTRTSDLLKLGAPRIGLAAAALRIVISGIFLRELNLFDGRLATALIIFISYADELRFVACLEGELLDRVVRAAAAGLIILTLLHLAQCVGALSKQLGPALKLIRLQRAVLPAHLRDLLLRHCAHSSVRLSLIDAWLVEVAGDEAGQERPASLVELLTAIEPVAVRLRVPELIGNLLDEAFLLLLLRRSEQDLAPALLGSIDDDDLRRSLFLIPGDLALRPVDRRLVPSPGRFSILVALLLFRTFLLRSRRHLVRFL